MWCGAGSELDDLVEIAERLPLPVDVYVTAATPAELSEAVARIGAAGGSIRWAGLKLFADGSLGGATAAMDAPFCDRATTGTLRLDGSANALCEGALDLGGTIAVHAIGDRANTAALDLFATLRGGWADPGRFRIEHASVLSPALVERIATAGITVSMQPAFMPGETAWLANRIGDERLRWTYPFRSLLEAGVPIIAGSDSPVENPNPWPAIAALVDNPLTADESITIEQALAMFGSGAVRVGDSADIVAVDHDPGSKNGLATTNVVATYIAGERTVWEPAVWTD
jgi:predicted amidohydrolase YtcJ